MDRRTERYLTPYRACCLAILVALAALFATATVLSADSVCAVVKIVILQELTFERVAFDAFLAVTNNLPDQALENFQVTVSIKTLDNQPADDKFFIRVLSLDKVSGVDGSGRIEPAVRAEVHWLIIPSPGAGGLDPAGVRYKVSATVNFVANGLPQTIPTLPDTITVKPQPELVLDYFLPAIVEGDDPFTDAVEAPVPFSLAVRVKNDGFGPANKLKISSAQPKIVENKQGLLVDFRLLGSQINGQEVTPSLTVQFGNILPRTCSTARWVMLSTLLGEFTEFNASFTHASELGGELTSLIRETNAHFLVREVLVDLPGRDNLVDFLVNTTDDHLAPPDRIFESSCQEQPVNSLPGDTVGRPGPATPNVSLTIPTLSGWVHTKVPDPSDGLIPLQAVIRSDGKRLKPQNFWQSREKDLVIRTIFHHHVQILDVDTTGSYTLVYQAPPADTTPPATTIIVTEPRFGADPVFVTSATSFLVTATDDISGVAAIEYKLSRDTEFLPFLPFNLRDEGPETITYRSRDRSGNQEADRTLAVFVDNSPPMINQFAVAPALIVPGAPQGATVAREAVITLQATDAISALAATLDIARGTGAEFGALFLVRTIQTPLVSGVAGMPTWNGRDNADLVVPEDTYTIRAKVSDPLGHVQEAFATVQVREFLSIAAVAAEPGADQLNPAISRARVVWQDNRSGDWDIHLHDFDTDATRNLTPGQPANQERPAIDGDRVVWQDRRNGNWDLFLHNLATDSTDELVVAPGDQERPAIAAPWVVYQSNAAGNWDIHAVNIETGQEVRITDHPRDQINPAIHGTSVVWEDYRHGLAEIYAFDLVARTERRITDNVHGQVTPTIFGNQIAWVDLRNENRDLYVFNLVSGQQRRLTFTQTDEAEPHLNEGRLVYTDFVAGLDDPNISLLKMAVPRRIQLLADPARQEHPRLSGNRVVWQDDRSGRFQIMTTTLDALPTRSLHVRIEPGFNLLATTDVLAAAHPSAFALLPALAAEVPARQIQQLDEATNTMQTAEDAADPKGTDFALEEGRGLVLISDARGEVVLDEPVQCQPRDLRAGINFVGVACLADGYTAFTVLETVGLDVAVSVSRIDPDTGAWRTAAVVDGQLVGDNFVINAGEGFLLHLRAPVTEWEP